MSAETDDRRVCVGVVGAPHGIKGQVRIRSHTADPLDIAAYGPLETEDGRRLEIQSLRPSKGVVVATLKGVSDRDGAEALKNLRLYVDRDRLPEPEDGEWYHADLIGLAVVDKDGTAIGTVASVQDFGGGDLLEVVLAETRRTVFVPFTLTVVPDVDIAAGRLVIDPPAGLFEEDEDAQ